MTYEPSTPGLVRAFDVEVKLGPVEDHRTTRAGHRRVVPVVGGAIRGEVNAEILPGGGDWQVVRTDGAIEIDCRYSARSAAGDLIYLQASGIRSGPPMVLDALASGERVDPKQYYFRTLLRFETAAADLAELEHWLFLASCVRDADRVRYVAYRVT